MNVLQKRLKVMLAKTKKKIIKCSSESNVKLRNWEKPIKSHEVKRLSNKQEYKITEMFMVYPTSHLEM